MSFTLPAAAGNLPVPCIAAGSCGITGPANWVSSGAATATQTANQLTVNQTSQNAILNWQSFNIGSGSSVNFVQPNSTALAINNIFQGSPSQIFGSLTANGRIYLINQNGIMFGAGAQVNTAGLVASSLNIAQSAIDKGIAQTVTGDQTTPSFVPFTDASGAPVTSGDITVAQGATLQAKGGQIFLFAPNVTNQGTISTPDGQTILAAGTSVYLATSNDPSVRGITVAVDGPGTVANGDAANATVSDPSKLIGQIVAQHGNVTLMGLAVNQNGLVSANTSVEENGTIMLVAANRAQGGTLTVGQNSVTQAGLDLSDTSQAVDATLQQKSTITLQGANVNVAAGSSITATSGIVTITGSTAGVQGSTDALTQAPSSTSDGSRIYIADGASIDVSGATAILPMSANSLQVELRGSELADDPNQRNGALRGQTVTVDVRQYGTFDGTSWVGTPLANLSADFATIQRGIQQRNEAGGTVTLQAAGDVIVGSNAKINVSGGATDYQSGYLNTSALLGADGKVYSISNASPDTVYKGVANVSSLSLTDLRWGVTSSYVGIYGTGQGQYTPGYVQGANAGTLAVNAPHVLLDGTLIAKVQVGPYQRNPQVANQLQQYNQLPLPGALSLGSSNVVGAYPDLVLTSIDLAPGPVLQSVHNANGTPFDPLTDPWPTSITAAMLNPELIGTNAAGRVQLYANDTITVPVGVDLELPLGGSFSAAASNINIAGTIASPGASITLQAEPTVGNPQAGPLGVTIAPTAVINVAGAWVNDNPSLTPAPATEPLPLNGGSVTIAARDGNITLSSGAVIDVSGGAQELPSGTLAAGKAGSISINTSQPDQLGSQPFAPTNLTLGATMRGYGVNNGGSLSISASSFCLTGGTACAPLSANQTSTGMVTLAPEFFTTGGFGSYSLTANYGGLEVTAGTQLSPTQENFILPPSTLLPSAPTLSGAASVGILPEIQRQPVNLAFTAQYVSPSGGNAVTPAVFATAPSLSLDKGSSIMLDPLAKVSLTSNTRILDDGTIDTPGGSVSMTVTASLGEQQFAAGHQLWLGPDSVIDVSGTVQAVTNDLGQTQGSVLPGGSVSLTADRGAVEALPGSFINVSGTTGTLDIQQVRSNGATTFVPTVIASAGGSVSIQAAEAAFLSGTMSAASGSPTTVPSGSFSLVLDGNERYLSADFPQGNLVGSGYPTTSREIQIANTQAPVVIAAGTDLPDGLDGQALVSTSALATAGFDSVKLAAPSLNNTTVAVSTTDPSAMVPGVIQFNGNVSLGAARSLSLDAASFLSTGGTATLSAPYVSLGQSQVITQGTPGTTNSGTGRLTVYGGMIDLVGNTWFGGFSQVTLNSTGDIRANGVLPKQGNTVNPQIPGALTVSGELDLIAQQVYPSTLSAFSFTAGAAGSGDLNVKQAAGAATGPLLSAGGSLTFNAPDITQDGTVRAPLGSIAMNATNITLATGSTTSTSTDGQTTPFGTTQGGFDWVYPLYGSSGVLVYGTDGIPLPTQSIQLSGTSVSIAKGASVDVKGGGDLLATEFIPGPTGTADVLGGAGSFAILPTSNLQFAPNDPYYTTGSGIFAGETIYLAGGGGIPAGTYAVLPARYALLPGAYYVTPESGFQDLTPGQHISQTDGSVIVAGYMSYAGTNLGASRTSGFDIEPGTAVQNLAQYTLTGANAYFTAQATAAGVTPQRLPRDAGYLGLNASSQLALDATLEATPGKGGLGAAVDISSSAIRVVNGAAAPVAEPGVLDLDANSLTELGAQSILLGGVRSQTGTGLAVTTDASTVEIASGATLKAPELLMAATNSVTVDGGATVGTTGTLSTSETALSLSGDGVLLRIAAAGNPITTRTGTSGAPDAPGQLVLMPGSIIAAAGGSVGVDVTSSADFGGTLQLTGGSLSITGTQISLGNAPAGTSGIVLPSAVLDGLSLANLSLSGRSSIDFWDGSNLSAANVTLSSGALRGMDQSEVQVSATEMLTLIGAASPSVAAQTGQGTGTLALNGGSVSVEAVAPALNSASGGASSQTGSLDVSGFSGVSVTSQGLLSLSGTGKLSVEGVSTTSPSGSTTWSNDSLNLEAGLLSGDSGASWTIGVTGAFAYNPTSNPSAIKVPAVTPLGASLGISADSIAFNGAAQLHAGALGLTATAGDITLGSNASIDLSAVNTVFDGLTVSSPAGSLSMQSQTGSISATAGSVINVSALDNSLANAGSLSAQAANGSINLNGSMLGSSADVSIDAQSLGNVPALEAALVTGGFSGDWNLRLRGPGDIVVPTGTANAIVGRSVSLTADQGNVDVEGTITSNSASGGSITLSAQNNVVVNGTLDARPQSAGQMNGQIELASEKGDVMIGSSATIEAYDPSVATQSLADGGLWIRAPQTTLETLLPGSTSPAGLVLAGNLQGLRSVTIEGFQTYTNNTGTIDPSDPAVTQMYNDAASFMANAPALVHALGTVKGPTPQIVPGIEIDSNQTLALNTAWDLSTWRPGGVAGVLTLRAAGDLNINASLSDGFTGTTGTAAYVLKSTDPSWSYRLVAGADLTSSNTMAVQPSYEFNNGGALAGGAYGTGTLNLAAGSDNPRSPAMTMIRTGTGSIDIAAAGNVTLGNQDSVIYTAGIADSGITYRTRGQFGTGGLLYPTEGGDISISAGGDVGYAAGAYSTDLVTNWLWRVGTDALSPTTHQPTSTAWTVNFVDFEQGVGALGGGNVTVTAGGNVSDLSVSVPTIGRQIGSATPSGSDLQVLNQGNILIRAGNNVEGGSLYDGAGSAVVVAGNQITQSTAVAGLYPVVLLGDADITLSARAGAMLSGVANPTLLPQGNSQNAVTGKNYSYFSTYGTNSAVTLQTTTGTAELVNDSSTNGVLVSTYGADTASGISFGSANTVLNNPDSAAALRIYPGTLTVDSLRGTLTVDNTLALYPEPNGSVNLLAQGAVLLGSATGVGQNGFELIQSNADPTVLPTVANPQGSFDNTQIQLDSLTYSIKQGSVVDAPVPVHLTGSTPDSTLSRIVSLTGDVSMENPQPSQLTFAAPAQIVAGQDLVNLTVDFTNLESTDVSALIAGRDVTYPLTRDPTGAINSQTNQFINVEGPGTLEVIAGRNINLGTSGGITSQGNLLDPFLTGGGAAVSLEAGVGSPNGQNYSTFIKDYLTNSTLYTTDLINYMQPFLGGSPTAAQALAAFTALPTAEQTPLIQTLFFNELLVAGTAAAKQGALFHNYTRGYDAIEALFANSVPSLSGNQPSPYSGDITLYFSRVYTLDGGDINLLAPGGGVNAGLAAEPSAFGVGKAPSQLGVVVQSTGSVNSYTYGDFEVNESRVFAANGGDILVWSTDGNIDAGRGAKTAISAPPPTINYVNGLPEVVFPAALTGSGIQALATSPGVDPGTVTLIAPNGVVNANDAGIVAGNLTIAATAVLGANNIKVSGVSIGVPVETGGLGASLAGVSAVASSASQAATAAIEENSNRNANVAPVTEAAVGWLDVFIEGFGTDVCKPSDAECLKREEESKK